MKNRVVIFCFDLRHEISPIGIVIILHLAILGEGGSRICPLFIAVSSLHMKLDLEMRSLPCSPSRSPSSEGYEVSNLDSVILAREISCLSMILG